MACQEAKDNGYDEALLLDINGNAAEGPGANLFVEKMENYLHRLATLFCTVLQELQ